MCMFKHVCRTLPYWTRYTLKNWNGNTFYELEASYCLQIGITLLSKKWHMHSFERLEWAYVLRTGIDVHLETGIAILLRIIMFPVGIKYDGSSY